MNILALATLFLSTILTALPFVAHGFEGSNKAQISTELGFKTLQDASAPFFVEDVSKSVYKVQIVSEDSPNDIRVFDLASDEFKAFEAKVNSLPKEQLSSQEKITVLKQIERCKRDHLEKQCPILLTFERATAFLAGGDGSYLLTNAHVVHRYLALRAAIEKKTIVELLKEPQWVPIFLFDRNGNLIFDPYQNPPTIVRYGIPSGLALTSENGWYAEDSDYVVIKLPIPIGKPLKIADSKTSSETLFRFGYPSCTGCLEAPNKTDPNLNVDRKPYLNSNGQDLYWTAGRNLKLTETADILGISSSDFEFSHKANWIFFSADAQVGMSGGPILNKSGEVIGVFAGSKPKIKEDGSMIVISRGVRPPEFNKQ